MSQQPVILVGAGGTTTAFGAVMALRRHWSSRVRIVVCDMNPPHLVTTSVLADAFEQVPPARDPAFPAALLDLFARQHIHTWLPLLPDEIRVARDLSRTGRLPTDFHLLTGSDAAAEISADKLLAATRLEAMGVRVPRTALGSQPFPATRYFLKPRAGTGSRGARAISAEELPSSIEGDGDAWIVQESGSPPEVTVDAFYDPGTGFCRALGRERIEIKAGVSTKARIFEDPELSALALRLGAGLSFQGSFCFQVMRFDGHWGVVDLNTRPGGATAMCWQTGNDFFAATFALAWGEDINRFFRPLDRDVFVTRQYAEFVTG
jgi:carbamoyl-phosphate synthase large subunit